MNKKGFTLIEIIICLVLLITIGSTSTIVIVKNNKKNLTNEINNLNKKILQAASVFTEIEKDSSGNYYSKSIIEGAQGLKIPLNYLVKKGYITETDNNNVYTLNELDKHNNYYVLISQQYCENGPDITLSWTMAENYPVYLCTDYKKYQTIINVINNIQEVNNNVRLKIDLDKNAVSQDFYNSSSETAKQYLTPNENGIFTLYNEDVGIVYTYYRGAVDNNYVKLGLDSDGSDLLWRILWYDDTGKMKLVLDKEIPPISLKNKSDEDITINSNDILIDIYKPNKTHYYILNPIVTRDPDNVRTNRYSDFEYIVQYDDYNKLMKDFTRMDEAMTSNNNIYFKALKDWYSSTDLDSYSFITNEKNFCKNDLYVDRSYDDMDYTYYPSNNFNCAYGWAEKERELSPNYSRDSLFYSSSIGHLTYGDVIRAGITKQNVANLNSSGNFLLANTTNNFVLVDYSKDYGYNKNKARSFFTNFFYVTKDGLKSGTFYSEERTGTSEDAYTYYTLKDEKNETIYSDISNNGSNGMIYKKTTFLANSVKPTIIVDVSNKKLSSELNNQNDEGKLNNPFVIVDK